jgi:CheY-like chemotaxis protein
VSAGSGAAALSLLRERSDITLLLVDFAMPGMNGAELAQLVRRQRPALPIVFVTGYADLAALRDVPEDFIINKPYRDDDLARKLARVIESAGERAYRAVRQPARA